MNFVHTTIMNLQKYDILNNARSFFCLMDEKVFFKQNKTPFYSYSVFSEE